MPKFSDVAKSAATNIDNKLHLYRTAAVDKEAEWHRVYSYLADVLKDTTLTYSKLVRLQSDFSEIELEKIQEMSESILVIGDDISQFLKMFYEGKYETVDLKGFQPQNPPQPPQSTIPQPSAKSPQSSDSTPEPKVFETSKPDEFESETDYSMEDEEEPEKPKKKKE